MQITLLSKTYTFRVLLLNSTLLEMNMRRSRLIGRYETHSTGAFICADDLYALRWHWWPQ